MIYDGSFSEIVTTIIYVRKSSTETFLLFCVFSALNLALNIISYRITHFIYFLLAFLKSIYDNFHTFVQCCVLTNLTFLKDNFFFPFLSCVRLTQIFVSLCEKLCYYDTQSLVEGFLSHFFLSFLLKYLFKCQTKGDERIFPPLSNIARANENL